MSFGRSILCFCILAPSRCKTGCIQSQPTPLLFHSVTVRIDVPRVDDERRTISYWYSRLHFLASLSLASAGGARMFQRSSWKGCDCWTTANSALATWRSSAMPLLRLCQGISHHASRVRYECSPHTGNTPCHRCIGRVEGWVFAVASGSTRFGWHYTGRMRSSTHVSVEGG